MQNISVTEKSTDESTAASTPALLADVVDELMPTLGSVRRLLRRAAGAAFPGDRLTAAQREVVLLVGVRSGRSVSRLAAELGLASNTVSTLVSGLVAEGWLVREPDPQDRRVSLLRLTDQAQCHVDAVRARRRRVLHDALRRMDPGQVAELRSGLGALRALGERLGAAEAMVR